MSDDEIELDDELLEAVAGGPLSSINATSPIKNPYPAPITTNATVAVPAHL